MSNWISLEKNDALLRLFILDVAVKLIISPWATGDFIASWGILISYACDGGLLVLVAIQLKRFPKEHMPLVWVFLGTAFTYSLSTFLFTTESVVGALTNHLKLFLPILAVPTAMSLATHSRLNIFKLVYGINLLVVFLIILGLATFPPSMNRMVAWLPTYFGGLHTSAYVALMTMFCIHALWSYRMLPAYKAWPVMLLLIYLIFTGWGVRTASIGVVMYFVGLTVSRFLFLNRPFLKLFLPLIVAGPIGALPLIDFAGKVDDMSSGRISMYIAKYNQLSNNDFFQWFIGNGYLSDLILTDVWWWAPKGAHSDVISFLVEGGMIYLGSFIFIIVHFIKVNESLAEKLVVVAILSTSLFSNGVFARPIASYLLSMVFVIHYSYRIQKKQNAQ